MSKKLLIYNMPEDVLEVLENLSSDYNYEIIIADSDNLGHNVAYLVGENDDDFIHSEELEDVDINFMMIHNFSNESVNEFLNTLNQNGVSIPNKCVSTENNLSWHLHKLLLENKEESEIMPVLQGLYKLRAVGIKLLESGIEDKELEENIKTIDALISNGKEFERQELVDIYNPTARIVNKYLE